MYSARPCLPLSEHESGLGPSKGYMTPLNGQYMYSARPCLPLSEHESGLGLGFVEGGWGAADDDGGAGVASQGFLQDTGHLAVTIRDVGFLGENVSESQ